MNRYSRVFHHISVNDIKRNAEKNKKIDEKFLLDIRNARNFLRDLNSPLYSDWKDSNSNLKEEITNGTGGVFYTTFPSTGDVNLENIDGSISDNYTDAGGNDAFEGTSIRSSGTGEGSEGGFDLGQNYLGFDGEADSRWAILNPIDSSKFDTLVLKAIRGDDNNGGEDPDASGEELRLYYLEPGGSTFRSISINPDGDQILPADSDVIIPLSDGTSQGLRNWSVKLPSYARGAGFTYMLFQLTNSGSGFDHFGVTNIKYQRKGPVSLFVSLDSPEATSFINDGSGGMTTEQKKKKLEDMLAASEEYIDLLFPENQAAVERAKQNLQRNIELSLDPNTFSFPEYGTPTYNQMYNTKIDVDSDTVEIERYLEQQGVTIDDLSSLVVKNKGQFKMGKEATLTLLNNQDTQEKAFIALGIDPGILTNLTPDSFDKISKITNLRPGGTPTSGWDGKWYELGDPSLEASQILSLDDYLRVKGTDNYAGIEKPAEAEPGRRYVMEKPYSFSQDSEARPEYVGVRNKDIEDKISNNRISYKAFVGNNSYVGGHAWDYSLYTGGGELGGSPHMLQSLVGSASNSLNYIAQNADSLAYEYLSRFQNGETKGIYKDLYNQYKDVDVSTNYDPLWILNSDPKMSDMLTLLRGLSSGRDLDYDYSQFSGSTPESIARAKSQNDRLYDNLQKAFARVEAITSIDPFEKDEWYLKNDDVRNVTGVSNTHPYADQMRQNQQQPSQPPETSGPDDSYSNIQVGDDQVIKQGNETVVDTMRGIDNRQKNSIQKEMDRIQRMPPDVRKELTRLLDVAGTSEYTPTSPKTKKEIEDYWASLPPEVMDELEGRTQASGVDALGLGLAILAALALAPSAAATLKGAIGTAVTRGLSKAKNLMKAKPKPTQSRYPTSSPKTVTQKGADFGARMRGQVAKDYGGKSVSRQGGKSFETTFKGPKKQSSPNFSDAPAQSTSSSGAKSQFKVEPQGPTKGSGFRGQYDQFGRKINPKTGKPLKQSYEPEGKLINEKSKDHNETIAKQGKLKSPSEFFKRSDIKPVYPDTPPPEMINGRHPDWRDDTKLVKRFSKLDPESARAMPDTGSPQVDALIRAARKKPK